MRAPKDAARAMGGPRSKPAPRAPGSEAGARSARPRRAPAAAPRLRREEGGERVSVYLPPALARALRVRCAKERRSVSDAVTAAVKAWLGRGAKAPAV